MLPEIERLEQADRVESLLDRLGWVIRLRWVGLLVIALVGLVPQATGYARFELDYGWWVAPPTILYNLLFWLWCRATARSARPVETKERSLRWQTYLQALCDIVILIALVYLEGGIEHPIVYLPLVAVILDGLLLSRRGVFIQANLGAALFTLMAVGEYQGWLPHIPYLYEAYRHNLYQDLRVVLSVTLSMVGMLNLAAFLISSLGGRLGRSEEQMRALLGRLERQVRVAVEELNHAAQMMRSSAEQLNLVADQIAATVGEIARGAGEQARQVETLSRNLDHMAESSRRVAQGSVETLRGSEEAVAAVEQGRQAGQMATARMDEIAQVFVQAEMALEGLVRLSEEIAEVALMIDRFAERTDLLALNAGIEAARAGEHGRGFAVVAGEVKKLAASSSASAEQVGEIVAQIQGEIGRVVAAVKAGRQRVQDGQEALRTLGSALDTIAQVIRRVAELAGMVEHLFQQQKQLYTEITGAVASLAAMAEETAAGSEETAAAVEEQVASFADLGRMAEEVAGLAERLTRSIGALYQQAGPAASDEKEEPAAGGPG